MVDIENMHWQMLEHSSQRLGHILADGTEETNNEELERIVPSRPESFQLVPRTTTPDWRRS